VFGDSVDVRTMAAYLPSQPHDANSGEVYAILV
jgi:hypothetical protein